MKTLRDKLDIDLLFENNLEDFLIKHELYDDFINNKIRCENCNKIITLNNLGYMKFIKKGKILFFCNDFVCLRE